MRAVAPALALEPLEPIAVPPAMTPLPAEPMVQAVPAPSAPYPGQWAYAAPPIQPVAYPYPVAVPMSAPGPREVRYSEPAPYYEPQPASYAAATVPPFHEWPTIGGDAAPGPVAPARPARTRPGSAAAAPSW